MNHRTRISDWLFAAALCAFLFLWRLASFGLLGADEPRYAQVAREMLATGDWVTPKLGGTAWLEKPPLYYWQALLCYRLFGVSDWAARLPAMADATILVFAVYYFLRRFQPGSARSGALLLASTAGMVGYARAASTDMPLSASFTVAMLAWYSWFQTSTRALLIGFYAAIALAMLAKGPVAPFLAILILGLFLLREHNAKMARDSLSLTGLLVFLLIAMPWYVLVQLRNPQFFRVFVLQHNLARFASNMFHHPQPIWYYLPVTILGWIPCSIFVLLALSSGFRQFKSATREGEPDRFLLIWILVVVAFFSLSISKLPGYILPALPPGILLIARYLETRASQKAGAALIILQGLLTTGLVLAALLLPYLLGPHQFHGGRMVVLPLVLATLAGAVVSLIFLRLGFKGLSLVTVIPAMLTVAITLGLGAPAIEATLSARSVANSLAGFAPGNLPVAVVLVPREIEFGLEFYRNQIVPRYELGEVPAGEHLVVAREGFRDAFSRDVRGRRILYLGSSPAQRLEFFYVSAR
ncbi:MAG: glycosyltransferase family 39 protein [Acidobacteria bacterium]|nr:glycosyltransferase family 39 protein [Acidobacteriota bacterium]